jgi:hypothetical protein
LQGMDSSSRAGARRDDGEVDGPRCIGVLGGNKDVLGPLRGASLALYAILLDGAGSKLDVAACAHWSARLVVLEQRI